MELKGRKIISILTDGENKALYLKLQNGRFAFVALQNVARYISTWKIFVNGSWKPLLDHINDDNTGIFILSNAILDLIDVAKKYTFLDTEGEIVIYKEGYYLLENGLFLPKDSKEVKIYEENGFQITFSIDDKISIIQNGNTIHKNLLSIEEAKELI